MRQGFGLAASDFDHFHLTRRRMLAGGLFLLPGVAKAGCAQTKVLFVCAAGTVKSAIAREALRARVRERSLPVEVRSRGLQVEDHVSPALAARLKADGLMQNAEPAQTFAPLDASWADIVIAFDEAASAPDLATARAWNTPSWNADYDQAKADLHQRLEALLTELAKRPCRSTPPTVR